MLHGRLASCLSPTCWRRRSTTPSSARHQQRVNEKWQLAEPLLRDNPASPSTSCRAAARRGSRALRPEGRGAHLKLIATRGEAFYRGEIAEAIGRHAREHGGAMTARPRRLLGLPAGNGWVGRSARTRGGRRTDVPAARDPAHGQGIAALAASAS